MLIDSNIIIYSARPEYVELRRFLADNAFSVSALSYVEVLGYHQLSTEDRLGSISLLQAIALLGFVCVAAPLGVGRQHTKLKCTRSPVP